MVSNASLGRIVKYEVEITQEGRGGTYYYIEQAAKLPFDWDFSSQGVSIVAPTPDEWDSYCSKYDADWAKGRRQEILQTLAEEVRRRKAKSATITIEDHWVNLSFKDSWVFSLLKSLFRKSDGSP
jgi:hypothetical protein